MRYIYSTCLLVLLTTLVAWAREPPVDREGRPLIKKLGTIAVDVVENSPVVFHDKLYIFMGRHQFHFIEHETGRKTTPFTSGYFGNAFVDGDTVYVTIAGAGPQEEAGEFRGLSNRASPGTLPALCGARLPPR